ncbi:hypothetical protein [Bianquea renquensis]|uniref:Gram-positive cocci surface proteins LPxTG domain-containing protein n=1 Tax=Bianquea renquensis TaxID=2763661 RepID=A0A926DTD9_9FIRM|nr:hypothetical protein [Bianquea renquensis]MBC8543399.1 hypothetical protein [Bianquea renquensis]
MKKKKRRAVLLAVVMLLAMTPMTAFAVPEDEVIAVVIGNSDGTGIGLDADTPYYVNGDLSATDVEPQNWNAYFDAGSSTLYLNNLSISGYYKYHDSYYWTTGLLARRDLTISVSGTNTIRNTAPDTTAFPANYNGLLAWSNDEVTSGQNYDLVITSSDGGSLEVSTPSQTAQDNNGIVCKEMAISGSAQVKATGGVSTASDSSGITARSLAVSGSAQVEATASDAGRESMGVAAVHSTTSAVTVSGNASLKASSGTSNTNVNCGIYTGTFSASGNAQVEARGNSGSGYSAGIYARGGSVVIEDSASVYAAGGESRASSITAWNGSYGVMCLGLTSQTFFDATLTIKGGSLTAIGNQWAVYWNPVDLSGYTAPYTVTSSANIDGSNPATYAPNDNQTYKYLSIALHEHQWGESWTGASTHHWHECLAAGCPVTDNSAKDGYAEHVYNQKVVDDGYKANGATCTEPAEYYYSCVCGAKGAETFISGEATGHDWGEPVWNWAEDYSSATVTFTCQNDQSHTASPEVTVTSRTTAASCTESGETTYTASATFNGMNYTDTKTAGIHATGHTPGTKWMSDGTNHWHECTACGEKLDEVAHSFEWVTDKAATATEAGSKHEECTVCGYKKASVEIPATGTSSEPAEPSEPTEPTEPAGTPSASGDETDSTTAPATGDNTNVILWLAILLTAGAALTGTVMYRRKRAYNR